jgi:hypothetical protein
MGLNRFGGQVDAQFPIGPLAMTRMAGPPDLMRQEDTILEHSRRQTPSKSPKMEWHSASTGCYWWCWSAPKPEFRTFRHDVVEKLGVHKPPALRIVDVRGAIPFDPPWRTRITNGRY